MLSICSTAVVLGALLRAVAGTSSCAADNCLRAVRASAFPTRMGVVDCSSYFMVTVTPATSVIISTSTSIALTTTTVDVPGSLRRRVGGGAARAANMANIEARQMTVSASHIPAYASACSGAARYSSACSCVGVTHSTITVAPPLTTTTTTATATSVITSTSVIPEGPPTIEVLNYQDLSCQDPDNPPSMIITLDQCQKLPSQLSTNYGMGSFNPGNCQTTAADCIVSYFFDQNCEDFAVDNSVDSTTCMNVSAFFSMELTCLSC